MTCETDAQGNLLPDAQRLNGYGKFLRSTSLDELPEIERVNFGEAVAAEAEQKEGA